MTQVKICGMTRWQDVKVAAAKGANFIGFIHSDRSKRNVSLEEIKELIGELKKEYPSIKSVCVVTTDNVAEIDKLAVETKCDYIQIHNDMLPSDFNKIEFVNKIRVFRVSSQHKMTDIEQYNAPYYLWDTYSKDAQGGTGESFDWDLIPKEYLNKSFVAGGISSKNINGLIKRYRPFAVDLSSSLELRPGVKSKSKIQKIFRIIKRVHINER